MKIRRKIPGHVFKGLLALAAIALVIAWQADLFKSKTPAGDTEDTRSKAEAAAVISVTETASPRFRQLPGRLAAPNPVDILARTSGEVREIMVEAGERIEDGELLVRLDDDMLRARRDEAAAALAVAQAEKEGASRLNQRIESAAEARALPETDAIDARRAFESATRRVEQARAALRAAEVRLDDTRVRSPISGIVVDTFKNPGDWVPPGAPLLSLFDPEQLEIEVGIPDALASRLTPGLQVSAFIEPLDQFVSASVRTLVPLSDPASRTVLAKLTLNPPEGALPGMYVRIELEGETTTAIEIPRSAVREIRQLDFVSSVDAEGRITPRWIRLGSTRAETVTVLAGLTAGDRILRHYGVLEGSATTEETGSQDHE